MFEFSGKTIKTFIREQCKFLDVGRTSDETDPLFDLNIKDFFFVFSRPFSRGSPSSFSDKQIKDMSSLLEQYKKENQLLKDTLSKGNLNTKACVDRVSNAQKQLKEEQKTLQEANETLEKIRFLEQQIEQLTHTIETKDQTIKSIAEESRLLLEKAEQKVKKLESRIQELEKKDRN